jgi:ribosomal protein S18 acetylase RimI-like enzyme
LRHFVAVKTCQVWTCRLTGVCVAAFIVTRSEAREGPQPFDPSRHMRQVADLVATVFSDELDARGRGALREMQVVGRLSPMLGDALSMALFNEFISGHVWLEGGRVIGNVTLQAIDQAGSRWRISNVAVLPSHRRQGIARALMLASLREVAQRQGNWAVLQVRADNEAAHNLYLALGFEDVARDAVYRLPAPPLRPGEPGIPLEPLRTLTGGEMVELARASRSALSQWAEPVRATDYELGLGRLAGEWLGRLSGLYRVERWAAWDQGQLMGAVETRAGLASDYFTLRFAVRPARRGWLEHALVAQGLAALARAGGSPVIVEHDGEHLEGTTALLEAGFRVQRDLITMRRPVRAHDLNL